jgi:hypothetical protein
MSDSTPDTVILHVATVHSDIPLTLFIIFCFFASIALIATKTYWDKPPSILTMSSQSFLSITSCAILMGVGLLSVYLEWSVMIVFVLIIMLFMTGIINPINSDKSSI